MNMICNTQFLSLQRKAKVRQFYKQFINGILKDNVLDRSDMTIWDILCGWVSAKIGTVYQIRRDRSKSRWQGISKQLLAAMREELGSVLLLRIQEEERDSLRERERERKWRGVWAHGVGHAKSIGLLVGHVALFKLPPLGHIFACKICILILP